VSPGRGSALHVWQAPAAWQSIDFISDLHLSPQLPRTVAAWAEVLQHTTADAICMLGDVFEVWVGDDSRHQPFEQSLVDQIKAASARRPVFFMHGNRDFLVGSALCADAGMSFLPDPTCLQAWGRRWLLSHGDAQCLSDHRYQAFRAQVRSPAWQQNFLDQPLADRVAQAQAMRRASQQHRQAGSQRDDAVAGASPASAAVQQPAAAMDGDTVGDLDAERCRAQLTAAAAPVLIHGHTHRPANHDLGDGLQRQVLSDWDLDNAVPSRAEVLRLRADGPALRLTPAQACGR
jgi:UDP-2,3-diacylglucosamine hydrolase